MNANPLSKADFAVERLRRPVSTVFVLLILLGAIFTRSAGHATRWYEVMEFAGYLLLMIAALGRVWAIVYIGGRKTRELCQRGPYSLCRNPLYFFSFLGVVGVGLALQNLLLTGLLVTGFLTYYAAVIRSEERRLAAVHGAEFESYARRVPRFWPRFRHYQEDEELVVRIRPFRRALFEVFWFLAVIVGADLLERLHEDRQWPVWMLPI
ncbi:MAG: methyltransferase family protein [Limisphaerales bacterium]